MIDGKDDYAKDQSRTERAEALVVEACNRGEKVTFEQRLEGGAGKSMVGRGNS